jgi:hypothetical protein
VISGEDAVSAFRFLEDSCCDPLRYLVVIFMVHCLRSCY